MMAPESSSQDLHPQSGARFVFARIGADAGDGYTVTVYPAGAPALETTLRWDEDGVAALEPAITDTWSRDQVLKLARVVKRTGQSRLTRWRG